MTNRFECMDCQILAFGIELGREHTQKVFLDQDKPSSNAQYQVEAADFGDTRVQSFVK